MLTNSANKSVLLLWKEQLSSVCISADEQKEFFYNTCNVYYILQCSFYQIVVAPVFVNMRVILEACACYESK